MKLRKAMKAGVRGCRSLNRLEVLDDIGLKYWHWSGEKRDKMRTIIIRLHFCPKCESGARVMMYFRNAIAPKVVALYRNLFLFK